MDSDEEEDRTKKRLEKAEEEITRLKRRFDDVRRKNEVLETENKRLKNTARQSKESARLSADFEESWHSHIKNVQKDYQKTSMQLIEARSDLNMQKIEKSHLRQENARLMYANQDLREEVDEKERDILIHERNCRILRLQYNHAMETNKCLRNAMEEYLDQVKYTLQCPVTLDSIYEMAEGICVLNCGHFMAAKAFENITHPTKRCPVCKTTITDASYVRFADDILQNFRVLATNSKELPTVNPFPLLQEEEGCSSRDAARRRSSLGNIIESSSSSDSGSENGGD